MVKTKASVLVATLLAQFALLQGLKFTQDAYQVSVLENVTQNALLLTLHVQDAVGGNVVYEMLTMKDSRSAQFFKVIPNNGSVMTCAVLDREFMASHQLSIIAKSGERTASTTLTIDVLDVNDNPPVFESDYYNVSVHESTAVGTPILTFLATDLDQGDNGRVSYSILSGAGSDHLFKVDSATGVLTLRSPLDHEVKFEHILTIYAKDNAKDPGDVQVASAKLLLNVLDDNDNFPIFDQDDYSFDVFENQTFDDNPSIGKVLARDMDSGKNADMKYSIIGGNNHGNFKIDPENGAIFLSGPLDREGLTKYNLLIRAQDSGNPPKSNTTNAVVHVMDVNDNPPLFPTGEYYQSISENAPAGFSLIQIKAFDPDQGNNAEIKYSISNIGDVPFVIEPKSGWLVTDRKLDREKRQNFHLDIEAQDDGIPPMTATAAILIDVIDANDNDPRFEQKEYTLSITETTSIGKTILMLKALDTDEDSILRYELVSGNKRNRFTLSTKDNFGILSVAQPLDFQQENKYILTVNAVDEGGRFGTCMVIIDIKDANNHAPRFEKTPYFSDVFEDTPVGSTVLMVYASDKDFGENAAIKYRLKSPNRYFSIDSTSGAIVITEKLDRESKSTHVFTVVASDQGNPPQQDSTDVEISVIDVNDNAPIFRKQSYSGSLLENAPVGTKILRVQADDPDENGNGEVSFFFAEDVSDFVIDPHSGDVRSNQMLDREQVASYNLTILAMDGGEPKKTSQIAITIDVMDINDNPPVFSNDSLVFHLAENSPYGTKIGKIFVNDPDSSENAQISFFMLSSPDSEFFYLDDFDRSGGISLFAKRDFDYELDRREFKIGIRAESPPLQTDTTVTILLDDINDNEPELRDFHLVYNLKDNEYSFESLGKIPAHDPDPTSELKYTITSGNNAKLLVLDEFTGEIRLSPQIQTNIDIVNEIGVMVSDGQNDARATLFFQMNRITDSMLANSVTLQVVNVTIQNFLNIYMEHFKEALVITVSCKKEDVVLLGIKGTQEDSHVVNATFSIRQESHFKDVYIPPSVIKQMIYLQMGIFQQISRLDILPFSDDVCVKEPCLNFEHCVTVPKFGSTLEIFEEPNVRFRSIETLLTYSCFCPSGFTGLTTRYTCDTKIDLCYSSPCQNGGICSATESGYYCDCPTGFQGQNCEEEDLPPDLNCDTCSEECRNITARAKACSGSVDNSRGFQNGSYLAFPGITNRVEFKISLSFATLFKSGLLFYNGRLTDNDDFIKLELFDDILYFQFSTGNFKRSVSLTSEFGFSNGKFHQVEVQYSSGNARISINDCDTKLFTKYGSKITNKAQCTNATNPDQSLLKCGSFLNHCPKFLDLNGPLMMGGLPLWISSKTSTIFFNGCIRDIFIDDVPVPMDSALLGQRVSKGCLQKKDFCASNPCQNEGVCSNRWNGFNCQCQDGYTGKECSKIPAKSYGLIRNSGLQYEIGSEPIKYPWHHSVSFKTKSGTAKLLQVNMDKNVISLLKLVDGHVFYDFGGNTMLKLQDKVNDGFWHNLEVKWMRNEIWVNLDYGALEQTIKTEASVEGKLVTTVVNAMPLQNFITGCVRDLTIMGQHESNLKIIRQENLTECSMTPLHADLGKCSLEMEGQCTSYCSLELCHESSTCLEDNDGYKCLCTSTRDTKLDKYCFPTFVQSVCPRHWWGTPVCGPCNCETSKGFNETCNSLTGACQCKEFHFYSVADDICLPCDCSSLGSISSACDSNTGQCQCKNGIIGRQCNTCANQFAELAATGCAAVYGSCPSERRDGIRWERTEFGGGAQEACPESSHGKVVRNCSTSGWMEPDFRGCTHRALLKLTGMTTINDSTIFIHTLKDAIPEPPKKIFQNDIEIVFSMLEKIMAREKKLTGFQLGHRRDRDFLDNLIEIFAWVLSHQTHTADYVKTILVLNEYGTKLAKTMEDTLTKPTKIIQSNLIFALDKAASCDLQDQDHSPYVGQSNMGYSWGDWKTYYCIPNNHSSYQFTTVLPLNQTILTKDVMMPSIRRDSHLTYFSNIISFVRLINNLDNDGTIHHIFKGKKGFERNQLHCALWEEELRVWNSLPCETSVEDVDSKGFSTVHCLCSPHKEVIVVVEEHLMKGKIFFTYEQEGIQFLVVSGISILLLVLSLIYLVFFGSRTLNTTHIAINIITNILIFQVAFILALVYNDVLSESMSLCKLVAIVFHYTSIAMFTWTFINSLHIYRMITELRDINRGLMPFYYAIGLGAPAIAVLLTMGVTGRSYHSAQFCWFDFTGAAMWAMLGPEILLVFFSIICTMKNIRTVVNTTKGMSDFHVIRRRFFVNLGLIPLVTAFHVSSLLLLNQGSLSNSVTSISFQIISVIIAVFVAYGFVYYESQAVARNSSRNSPASKSSGAVKSALIYTQPHHHPVSEVSAMDNLSRNISVASTTSYSTTSQKKSGTKDIYNCYYTDSESDLDRRSIQLASSHSSDEDNPIPPSNGYHRNYENRLVVNDKPNHI